MEKALYKFLLLLLSLLLLRSIKKQNRITDTDISYWITFETVRAVYTIKTNNETTIQRKVDLFLEDVGGLEKGRWGRKP